jgi:gliding-associated putative ABC transporter substrate-binding component GldG
MKVPRRLPRYLFEQTGLQSLLVIAIIVFGFLLVDNSFVRWDLTEDHRFTISEASHRIAASLKDPLTIRVYMSANVPPRFKPYQRQVRDVLEEYEAASGGKISVEYHDPNESRTAEGEASSYGVRPVQLRVFEATEVQVLQVYGGIVLVYRDRASEVINIAERFPAGYEGLSVLEYEVSSRIWQLSHERPKLGLEGYLEGVPPGPPMGPNRPPPRSEFQGVRRLLGESFDIEEVDLKKEQPDPAKIPLLLLVRPREMSDVEVFRLDQYLMKGGRVILFVTQGTLDMMPWERRLMYRGFKTGLDDWLANLGLRVPNEFVLHGRNANREEIEIEIPGLGKGVQAVESWWRPIISSAEAIDQNNPAVQTLDTISLFWPHPVDLIEGKLQAGVEAAVLVKSHEFESWRWKDHNRISMRDVDERRDLPSRSDLQASPLVVSLAGEFTSYYTDHPVPPSLSEVEEEEQDEAEGGEKDEEAEGAAEGEEKAKEKGPEVVKKSVKPSHLVVIGNSVFISDSVLGGQRATEHGKRATLLAFNLIDWLARSEDLIALRAKEYSNRALVDEDYKSDLEDLTEEAEAGEITAETFREEFDKAREHHMQQRKRWRSLNTFIPCLFVLVLGALVWILRAGFRSRTPRVPDPVAPSSVRTEE